MQVQKKDGTGDTLGNCHCLHSHVDNAKGMLSLVWLNYRHSHQCYTLCILCSLQHQGYFNNTMWNLSHAFKLAPWGTFNTLPIVTVTHDNSVSEGFPFRVTAIPLFLKMQSVLHWPYMIHWLSLRKSLPRIMSRSKASCYGVLVVNISPRTRCSPW